MNLKILTSLMFALLMSACYYAPPASMNSVGLQDEYFQDSGVLVDQHGNLYLRSGSYIEKIHDY